MSNTYYDVITRYSVEDRTTPALERMGVAAGRNDRMFASLHRSQGLWGGSFRGIAGMLSSVTGGMLGLSTVGRVIEATFGNLNQQIESTLSIAARFNASFTYAKNPIDNFTEAMGHARQMARDLTRDAAKLPGTSSDFFAMFSAISGPAAGAGIEAQRMRRMVGQLSIVAPMSQGTPEEAGRQMMRMLGGYASVGDNPLFVALLPFLKGGKDYNKQSPAQRFGDAEQALGQLAGNAKFLELRLNTLNTQWSTFTENLVGWEGVTGQIASPLIGPYVDNLIRLNESIASSQPKFATFADNWFALSKAIAASGTFPNIPFIGNPFGYDTTPKTGKPPMAESITERWFSGLPDRMLSWWMNNTDQGKRARDIMEVSRMRSMVEREISDKKYAPPPVNDLANQQINQTFNIHVDLKSDHSPEAIAVRVREGMAKAAKHPTQSRRMVDTSNPSP